MAKHNEGVTQLCNQSNTPDADVYKVGKYSVDVIFAKFYFIIYLFEMAHFIVVDMRCYATGCRSDAAPSGLGLSCSVPLSCLELCGRSGCPGVMWF